MRVRVQRIGQGDHPNRVLVEIISAMGPLRLVVDSNQLENSSIQVGYPLKRDNELVFVALPRPTLGGSFRAWVRAEDVLPDRAA